MIRLSLRVIGFMALVSTFAGHTYADEKTALRKSAADQIQVHGLAGEISDRRRWDVIVFKHPSDRNPQRRLCFPSHNRAE